MCLICNALCPNIPHSKLATIVATDFLYSLPISTGDRPNRSIQIMLRKITPTAQASLFDQSLSQSYTSRLRIQVT